MTSDHQTVKSTVDTSPRRRLPSLSTWLRLAATVLGAGLLYASFPPRPLWWLAPLGVALFAAALHGRRARGGFGYGFLFGMAYLLPVLKWLDDFLGAGFGPWPWLLLTAVEALFVALAAAGMALVSRLPAAPVWMAALFIGGEALRGRLPLNGFPWAKVGFSQPQGAFLPLAALGGSPLVGFAVILTGCGLAELARRLIALRRPGTCSDAHSDAGAEDRPGAPRAALLIGPGLAAALPVLAGLAATPLIGTDANAGVATVAIIQGNAPNAGLGLLNEMRTVRDNQLAAADELAAKIRDGQLRKPDLVIWPETGVDLGGSHGDPADIARISREIGVPMAVGALRYNPDGTVQNAMLNWPTAADAPVATYAKQELVPFSEYIPFRPIARLFTPFVDYFGDMKPGGSAAVFTLGPARVGFAICYEAAYDWVANDAVRAGATLLSVPTNNAWFGRTDMSYQQLAMSRLRAVEHGRAVVVSATSGVSAFVQPDGSVTQQTRLFTRDLLVATVPLRSTTTLATRLGAVPEWALTALGAAAVAVTVVQRRRRRRHAGAGEPAEPSRH